MTLQVLCKRGFCNSHISLGFQNRGCFLLISSAAQQLCYPRLCVLHVWKYTQRMAGSSCGTIVPTLVWPESRFTDWKFRFLQRVLHLVKFSQHQFLHVENGEGSGFDPVICTLLAGCLTDGCYLNHLFCRSGTSGMESGAETPVGSGQVLQCWSEWLPPCVCSRREPGGVQV